MILLILFILSCLHAPAACDSTSPKHGTVLTAASDLPTPTCGSNHNNTKLLLLANVGHDTTLTITRLENIVSKFIAKVRDGEIRSLDVHLVDPFNNKTFNLTNVTSLRDINSVLEEVQSNVSGLGNDEIYDMRPLARASNFSVRYIQNEFSYDSETTEKNNYNVVVFLSRCYRSCQTSLHTVRNDVSRFKDLLMIFLLTSPPGESTGLYSKYYQRDLSWGKHMYLIVNHNDDFSRYNPVSLYACRECPADWVRYQNRAVAPSEMSCYRVTQMKDAFNRNEASSLCQSMNSSLPVFETEDEVHFIRSYFSKSRITNEKDKNKSSKRGRKTLFVGLLKKNIPATRSFMWSNLRPFGLDSNLTRIASTNDKCVALKFTLSNVTGEDGAVWTLVNCEDKMSRVVFCEIEVNLIPDLAGLKTQIKSTENNRVYRSKLSASERDPVTFIRVKRFEHWGKFDCSRDDDEIVAYSSVCNGVRDCANSRDEEYCYTLSPRDKLSKFYCANPNAADGHRARVSVHLEEKCNSRQDCPDNSDELGCDGCLARQCGDGTCVPSHWLKKNLQKCFLFTGADKKVYLNVSYPCQGDCSGQIQFQHEVSLCDKKKYFEAYPAAETFHLNMSSELRWSPKCLYLKGQGGTPSGCDDQHQLRDCRTFECPEGFIKCPESYCVPVYNFGDEVLDCPRGEDEDLKLDIYDVNDMFFCRASDIYVHQVHICDGTPQCPLADDEMDCSVTCPPGFKCHGVAVSVGDNSQVPDVKSLNIFDIKTKFLNISGVDLSKLEEVFIFPNLLEIHATNCKLEDVEMIFGVFENRYLYRADFSYNMFEELLDYGPISILQNLQFLSLSHNEHLMALGYYSILTPKLHTLDISFTGISYLELFILNTPNTIRSLNLRQTKITKIDFLLTIKRLQTLNLANTLITDEDLKTILKSISVGASLTVDNFKFCCPQIYVRGKPEHSCNAPPEAFSSCEDLLSDVLKRSLLWLVAGISLAGNIIVITYRLFYDKGVFTIGYGVFVTNLSMSDCVMGVYLLIIASTDVRYRDEYVLHESDWRHSSLCQAAGFLSTLSSETSTFFVFLITLDRYLVIRFPFGDHKFTKLGQLLCVPFVWIFGFILASVPLMYPEWRIYSSNGMCLGLPLTLGQNLGWHYSFAVFICFNFILFMFIAIGQLLIFRLILSSHSVHKTNAQCIARRVQDIHVAKKLFLVVVSNFLCWFPICVLGLLTLNGHEVSPDIYAWLVIFVMPLNAAINPMIYTIPVIYGKWRDFKEGKTVMTGERVCKSTTLANKL